MWFPMLFEEIRRMDMEDYRRIGFRGNPAPSDLRRLEEPLEEKIRTIRIPIEPLESELKELIKQYFDGKESSKIYIFSKEGGAGEDYLWEELKDYCREIDIPFMDVDEGDIHEAGMDGIKYLMNLADVEKVVFFCEPGERGYYTKLLEIENTYIIGKGHDEGREIWGIEDKFSVFDLEDYPLTQKQLYELLTKHVEVIRIEDKGVISDEQLMKISQITHRPGYMLDILGVCLAVAAYKARTGREPKITDYDIENCSNRHIIGRLAH